MKEFKGRQTINYDRERSVDETCVAFAPMPMPLVKKALSVPKVQNPLDGVKSFTRETPVRPKNLVSLATALSNISKEPIEVVLQRLVKETMNDARSFSDGSSYYSDSDDVLRGYAFRSESGSLSEISAPLSAVVYDRNFGGNIQQLLSLQERGQLSTEELTTSIQELRRQQEEMFTRTEGSSTTYLTRTPNPLYRSEPQPARRMGVFSRPQSDISESEIPIRRLDEMLGAEEVGYITTGRGRNEREL